MGESGSVTAGRLRALHNLHSIPHVMVAPTSGSALGDATCESTWPGPGKELRTLGSWHTLPPILQIGEIKAAVIHLTDILILCHVLGRHDGQACEGDKEHMGMAPCKEFTLK